jgi:Neprosin
MKIVRLLAVLGATSLTLGLVAAPAASRTTHAAARSPRSVSAPKGMPSVGGRDPYVTGSAVSYLYVYGHQYATASGASVALRQARPAVSASDDHSLAELAVQSADGNQIVEVGWTVSPGLNGDTQPHLFVFHWVDRTPTCYNGCGFVQVSSTITPGDPVAAGSTGIYRITFARNKWWVYYNKAKIGYFPASLWSGRYKQAGLIQAFGEVSAGSTSPCTDMGNGKFGSAPESATISKFALTGSAASPSLGVSWTNASLYDAGNITTTSFRFGGPGAC